MIHDAQFLSHFDKNCHFFVRFGVGCHGLKTETKPSGKRMSMGECPKPQPSVPRAATVPHQLARTRMAG